MILLEQTIELSIVHNKRLLKFNVIETMGDTGKIIFRVMRQDEYIYTLEANKNINVFKVRTPDLGKGLTDSDLHSKIVLSLYAVSLKKIPS